MLFGAISFFVLESVDGALPAEHWLWRGPFPQEAAGACALTRKPAGAQNPPELNGKDTGAGEMVWLMDLLPCEQASGLECEIPPCM